MINLNSLIYYLDSNLNEKNLIEIILKYIFPHPCASLITSNIIAYDANANEFSDSSEIILPHCKFLYAWIPYKNTSKHISFSSTYFFDAFVPFLARKYKLIYLFNKNYARENNSFSLIDRTAHLNCSTETFEFHNKGLIEEEEEDNNYNSIMIIRTKKKSLYENMLYKAKYNRWFRIYNIFFNSRIYEYLHGTIPFKVLRLYEWLSDYFLKYIQGYNVFPGESLKIIQPMYHEPSYMRCKYNL